jgi:hypothetical protein
VPAGCIGNSSEIADEVVFFVFHESAFTAGGELLVDGGMSDV